MSVNGWRAGGGTGAQATTSTPGIVELATTAETQTGTDTTRAVTPASGSATYATQAQTVNLVDAKGDRLLGSADNTLVKHTAPANGKFSVADSAQSDGWTDIDLPWHVSVPVTSRQDSSVGSWSVPANSTAVYDALLQNAGALNDEINWKVQLGAGTWTLDFLYTKASYVGIATVQLGGSTIATVDGYNALTTQNNKSTTTGISVTTAGIYTLRFLIASKNASASATYIWCLNAIDFTRTA